MNSSVSRIRTLTGRNIKEILRDPLSLVFTLGLPLAMEILFYFIFHRLTYQFEMRYLAPGIAVFSQGFLTLFVGILMSTDRSTTFLTRLYVSPARSHEFILSYAISILPVVVVQSLLFFLVGGIFDHTLLSLSIVPSILVCLVTSLFFISMGILFGSVCNEKSIGGVSSIIIAGQSVLSGMWFPMEDLSEGFTRLMNALPFRASTLLVQNTMTGISDPMKDFVKPLAIVLVYAILALSGAVLLFMRRMKAR